MSLPLREIETEPLRHLGRVGSLPTLVDLYPGDSADLRVSEVITCQMIAHVFVAIRCERVFQKQPANIAVLRTIGLAAAVGIRTLREVIGVAVVDTAAV